MSKKQRTQANGAEPDGNEQFQRFEDLTRRLFGVSKEEADAKEAERKRRKSGKPR